MPADTYTHMHIYSFIYIRTIYLILQDHALCAEGSRVVAEMLERPVVVQIEIKLDFLKKILANILLNKIILPRFTWQVSDEIAFLERQRQDSQILEIRNV